MMPVRHEFYFLMCSSSYHWAQRQLWHSARREPSWHGIHDEFSHRWNHLAERQHSAAWPQAVVNQRRKGEVNCILEELLVSNPQELHQGQLLHVQDGIYDTFGKVGLIYMLSVICSHHSPVVEQTRSLERVIYLITWSRRWRAISGFSWLGRIHTFTRRCISTFTYLTDRAFAYRLRSHLTQHVTTHDYCHVVLPAVRTPASVWPITKTKLNSEPIQNFYSCC